jgi:stearoyl-CoA desaturase (delta-9 desaturase)
MYEIDPAAPVTAPFAPAEAHDHQWANTLVTVALVVGPVIAAVLAVAILWGRALHPRDLVIGGVLYVLTGHGITVGFHRMLTHGSFRPTRALKVALGILGSMAVQGSVISWVANHRAHHAHSDRSGDPHSPHVSALGGGRFRRFVHAHVGWLFTGGSPAAHRFAPDLLKDRDLVAVDRLFPVFAIASLAVPFALGWSLGGTLRSATTALVWGGLVRMALLHHVTWSINSVCHLVGRRPFTTRDQSRNVAALALVSMGESWHNLHHAMPSSARHGVDRWQLDSSARVIRWFEALGWATKVRWPTPDRLTALRADRPGRGLRGGRAQGAAPTATPD